MIVANEKKIKELDDVVQGELAIIKRQDIDLKLIEYDQCEFRTHCLHKMVFKANNGEIYLHVDFSFHRREGKKLDFDWRVYGPSAKYFEEGGYFKQYSTDLTIDEFVMDEWPTDVDLTQLENDYIFERIISCADSAFLQEPTKLGTIMTTVINTLKTNTCSLCCVYSKFV